MFAGFILKMTTQSPVRVGAAGLGRFLVPPGAGNSEAPHGERLPPRALQLPWASFPPGAWGPPGAGARDAPLLPYRALSVPDAARGPACGIPERIQGPLAKATSGGELGYRTWQLLEQFARVAKADCSRNPSDSCALRKR